ncbi:MAG: helix-turn-helix transcriptional regulator, partial [Gordonibacter urolithinfaciens]
STPTFPATLLLFVLFCIAALQLLATGGLDLEAGPGAASGPDAASADDGAPAEPEGPLDDVYRLAALVMMAGFLFVPVLGDFGVPGEAIVLAGYLGLSAVLVSLFLVMARITGQDAAQSFARGFTALFAGEMAGVALGNVIDVVAGTEQTPSVVVACAGLAALYAFLFLFTERDFRALSVIARDADRFDDACSLIAAEHGLSKREAEILPFALKGRTGERIAAEFYISKSTVDTHLRRIYAKCGVHGRQELIDLGERTERRLSGR